MENNYYNRPIEMGIMTIYDILCDITASMYSLSAAVSVCPCIAGVKFRFHRAVCCAWQLVYDCFCRLLLTLHLLDLLWIRCTTCRITNP